MGTTANPPRSCRSLRISGVIAAAESVTTAMRPIRYLLNLKNMAICYTDFLIIAKKNGAAGRKTRKVFFRRHRINVLKTLDDDIHQFGGSHNHLTDFGAFHQLRDSFVLQGLFFKLSFRNIF